MIKIFGAFLLITFATEAVPFLTSTVTPSWTLKNLEACRSKIESLHIYEKCNKNLPPELKHPHRNQPNPLVGYPELCCPAYEAFTCSEQETLKVDVCKRVWSFFKESFDEMRTSFPASGCHVEKCKKL